MKPIKLTDAELDAVFSAARPLDPDIQLARQHAIGIARELISTKSTLLREPISAWSVTVKDGKFQKLFSVPVADATPQ
jgi:hypothetical protein